MRFKVLEIFKSWGFKADGLNATKDVAGGKFVCDTITKIEEDAVVLFFYSFTPEAPVRRLQIHEIVQYAKLEQLPPDVIEGYLKAICDHLVHSVTNKILFGNYKDVVSALLQEEDAIKTK